MKPRIQELFRDRLFERNSETAYRENRMVLKAVSLAGIICMALLSAASLCVEGRPGVDTWFFRALMAMGLFLVLYGATVFLTGKMACWAGYLVYFSFVGVCIYTSAFLWPDDICIMMPAGLFVFPAFYLDKGWRVTLMTVVSSFLYVWAITLYKEPFCLRNELVSVMCFTVIGCITGASMRKMKLENIEHENEHRQNAQRDGMTGAYNRKTLEDIITRKLARSFGRGCALLLIDIDNLKTINDELGHPQGDRAIIGLADALRNGSRQTDLIGRIGGDEFIVFLENCGGENKTREIAGRIAEEIAKVRVGEHDDRPVTVSVGISVQQPSDHDFADLYQRADAALYRAKKSGKNQVSL